MTTTETLDGADDAPLPRLSRAQFWAVFAIALAVFLFAAGPIWRHAGSIRAIDAAALWSYAVIPPLVGIALLVSRRFSLRAFFLDALTLTLVKYAVTCTIAILLWATVAPPTASARSAPRRVPPPAAAEPAIAPTPIDPAATGEVRAAVVDAEGRPIAGALVFVAGGLEAYVFAPPGEPVVLVNGGAGVTPALAVAQVGQRILGRSADGHLHTLVASRGGETWFNAPLLPSGEPTPIRAAEAPGMAEARCNVHPNEAPGRLLVLAHPFSGWSDAEGRAALRGVPAGKLRITAIKGDLRAEEIAIELPARGVVEVRIALR